MIDDTELIAQDISASLLELDLKSTKEFFLMLPTQTLLDILAK